MQKVLFILLFLFSLKASNAQSRLSFHPYYGKIAKHKSGLLYETPPRSLGIELSYKLRADGSKAWHNRWNKPTQEISFLHYNLGNKDILGSLTAVVPHFGFYLKESENNAFIFHMGLGIGYVTRTYNEITNPLNNAIGSNINSVINFKFSYQRRLSKKIDFHTGLSFTHFSNGRTSTPNSGVNIPAFFTGISYALTNKEKDEEILYSLEKPPNFRRWGINIHAGYGIKEYDVPGGPNYSVKFISIGGIYATDLFNKIHFGWEYEYHSDEYSFARAIFIDEINAQKEARKQIIYIGDELIFGRISVRLQMGYYLVNTKKQNINTKLFINYRIPLKRISSTIYTGVMMKTHFAVANYLSLVAGYEF